MRLLICKTINGILRWTLPGGIKGGLKNTTKGMKTGFAE